MVDISRTQYKFMIPVDLKERIEAAAHDNRRSLSAEIIATLEDAFPAPVAQSTYHLLMERQSELFARFEAETDPGKKKILANELIAIKKRADKELEAEAFAIFLMDRESD